MPKSHFSYIDCSVSGRPETRTEDLQALFASLQNYYRVSHEPSVGRSGNRLLRLGFPPSYPPSIQPSHYVRTEADFVQYFTAGRGQRMKIEEIQRYYDRQVSVLARAVVPPPPLPPPPQVDKTAAAISTSQLH